MADNLSDKLHDDTVDDDRDRLFADDHHPENEGPVRPIPETEASENADVDPDMDLGVVAAPVTAPGGASYGQAGGGAFAVAPVDATSGDGSDGRDGDLADGELPEGWEPPIIKG